MCSFVVKILSRCSLKPYPHFGNMMDGSVGAIRGIAGGSAAQSEDLGFGDRMYRRARI